MTKFRTFLYQLAKFLGDVNAIKKGTYGKRIRNRAVGKMTSRIFKK
ncbi:hypothetical protein RUW00_22320 [Bacillus sp. IS1]|nr:hypothetical protein [Bacillus sp. IS1]KMN56372.1 phage protein [Bacillus sp. LK7]MDU0103970.1 hypothetical protein [Bacillus sp. IS1]